MNNIICGIYMIKNKVNNKVYIGQAVNIYHRWNNGHIKPLEENKHKNSHLQSAWNKYGQDNFEFNILEECIREQLNEKEAYWIAYYESNNNQYGYNKTSGGDKPILNEESKKKISKSNKGKDTWNKGKTNVYSEETLKKMSIKPKGRKLSDEAKLKIKNNNTHYWKDKESTFKGKKHSEESLDKISKALKGRTPSNKINLPDDDIIIMINRRNLGDSYNAIGKDYNINKATVKRLINDYNERRQGNTKATDIVPQSNAEEVTGKGSNKEVNWDNF